MLEVGENIPISWCRKNEFWNIHEFILSKNWWTCDKAKR